MLFCTSLVVFQDIVGTAFKDRGTTAKSNLASFRFLTIIKGKVDLDRKNSSSSSSSSSEERTEATLSEDKATNKLYSEQNKLVIILLDGQSDLVAAISVFWQKSPIFFNVSQYFVIDGICTIQGIKMILKLLYFIQGDP